MPHEIQVAARLLANAEADRAQAVAAHAEAVAHVEVIRGRIHDAEALRDAIRTDHQSGAIGDREAGGLRALADDDLGDLRVLLADAEQAARAADPAEAEQAVASARIGVERATSHAEFRRLTDHVAEAERVFCGALAALYVSGQGVGLPRALSACWRPSQALHRAVAFGVAPTPGAQ